MEATPPRGEWPSVLAWDDADTYADADEDLPPARRRRGRGEHVLVTACWGVLLTMLMLVAIGILVAKVIFGLTPLSVRSGSMEPAIPTYSLAFVENVPVDEVGKGDVITFDPSGAHGRVTHRVVKAYLLNGRRHFETRGDANPAVDDWRSTSGRSSAPAPAVAGSGATVKQSRGVSYGSDSAVRYVFHVPWLGRLGIWLERPGVREKATYVPFIMAALWMLGMIWARPFASRRADEADLDMAEEWDLLEELPVLGISAPPVRDPAAERAA